ncbi:F-box only protein 31-like [Myotis daubentonii]|uniref:F-box only protein 31-like n=1 Tax=Myotis daubentonii TaxID=98922 RepID=UPI002872B579|nr:F-box only protein 31-like [Myotis daubentonii]
MEECACLCSVGSSRGCRCRQECQGPAERAVAEGKLVLAEKHLEADTAVPCCAGSGGIASPMPPPHCFLQDLPNLEMMGMSYREVYVKLFPYRNILGLWQLDTEGYRTIVNVVVDGLYITGWRYKPSLNTHVDDPIQFEPSFRIRLTERKPATVECMEDIYYFSNSHHLQIQENRFSIQWIKRDHQKDLTTRLRKELGLVLEDRLLSDWLTYRRLYLPPSHLDDLIRPGLFHGKYDGFGPMIAMLSFHGKYAREIDEQVIREQQQQQENVIEESEGHGWQSPAQPSVGESEAAASEEQPVPFVLPVGMRSRDQIYPQTCKMCFYGIYIGPLAPFGYPRRYPGVFILLDENHFEFIWLEKKYFILFGRRITIQAMSADLPELKSFPKKQNKSIS